MSDQNTPTDDDAPTGAIALPPAQPASSRPVAAGAALLLGVALLAGAAAVQRLGTGVPVPPSGIIGLSGFGVICVLTAAVVLSSRGRGLRVVAGLALSMPVLVLTILHRGGTEAPTQGPFAEDIQRRSDVEAAISAASRVQTEFMTLLQRATYPDKAELVRGSAKVVTAFGLVKSRLGSYQQFLTTNGPELEHAFGVLPGASLATRRANTAERLAEAERLEKQFAGVAVRELRLAAASDWTSTGVSAAAGAEAWIWARGEWRAGPDWAACGPGGTDESSVFRDYRVVGGDSKLMAVLVRDSDSGAVHVAGAHRAFTTTAGGTIQVRCNDKEPSNNQGAVDLVLVVLPPAGR